MSKDRRLGLWQAMSLNMAMMVGIGPFITIPDLTRAVGGPWVLAIWASGAMLAMADGLVWSELAAAYPGSGGTYHFYDAIFGKSPFGRLMKFLFIWQFLFSAPLELASGAIGLARYAGFFWEGLDGSLRLFSFPRGVVWRVEPAQLVAMAATGLLVGLAYRRIQAAGRLMMALCGGMVVTMLWMIAAGCSRWGTLPIAPAPPSWQGAGVGLSLVMYCFLGYYQICYLGDEVEHPSRTLPLSILLSVAIVGASYFLLHLSILGVVPGEQAAGSHYIASDFMMRIHGPWAARLITGLILWTGAAGTYAALLSYSRVPYAAARAGHFFRGLDHLHARGGFPDRSLLLVGGLAIVACLVELKTVIEALLSSRILIQFVGQVATVLYLGAIPGYRRRLPFRMILYPLPAVAAMIGWLFVLQTSGRWIMAYGLGSMAAGIPAFLAWDRFSRDGGATHRRDRGGREEEGKKFS